VVLVAVVLAVVRLVVKCLELQILVAVAVGITLALLAARVVLELSLFATLIRILLQHLQPGHHRLLLLVDTVITRLPAAVPLHSEDQHGTFCKIRQRRCCY
jgi:hypothetical protein